MKKLVLILVALFALGATAYAAENVEKKPHIQGFISNRFCDNWEIQAGVGPTWVIRTGTGNVGDVTGVGGFIAANKWLHPVFGFRVAAELGKIGYVSGYGEKINSMMMYIHPDIMVNLSNWIGGYREDRFYSAVLTTGAGLAFTDLSGTLADNKGTNWVASCDRRPHEFTVNFALQNRFRVSKCVNIDLTLEYMLARASLYPVMQDNGARYNGLNVYVGATYRFNRRDFDRAGATEAEAQAALDRLAAAEKAAADAQADNDRLKALADEQAKALAAAEAQAAERDAALQQAQALLAAAEAQAPSAREAVETDKYDEILFYLIGNSALTVYNKQRLDLVAEHIKKSNSDKVFKIEGFADPQTGSAKINKRIANKRAKQVYDYLISKGVDASRIAWEGVGTENLPFKKQETNRVVVIF
ncbi:MAG: OmpA family protein [Alistipes sp.]|nr:OmpA family protein [Alistipes sp.]